MPPAIQLKPNNTIVFTGDSITDADRHDPAYAPWGNGYVHFVAQALVAAHPQLNLNIVNTGVGGDTIADLQRRWQRDCLDHQPDVLSVLIGINDVWHLATDPDATEYAATPEKYELTLNQLLLEVTRRCDCQIVLVEPFLFCADEEDPMLSLLRPYITIVQELAAEHNATPVPLQKRIDQTIAEVPPARWSQDRVHPYPWAHAWIAQHWRTATGL